MEKRQLGGLTVDAMGLGCMGMSFAYGDIPDQQQMVKLLQAAVENGETFFDTAEVYGPFTNETLLGKALAPYKDKVTIATKCGIRIENGKQVVDANTAGIQRSVEGSLQRLGVEAIDLYYLHRVDPQVPIEQVAYTMGQLKKAGKIKHWGLSEAGVATIRKAHAVEPLAAVESEYSLWTREPENELLPTLEELGIGFVPFSPLGKGYLTGKITAATKFTKGDGRNNLPRFTEAAIAANQQLLNVIAEFATAKQATPAQIALAWLLAQKPWIVPIPGTTKLSRLQENLGALKVKFTAAELAQLNDLSQQVKITGDRYTPELAKRAGL
ncbi:aldo/keto reductase [Lactiplantibacillus pentosus]|uniref:Aldo/keto reductase n=4 Tax=Lactiplantibacillus pentosus TaxID=1589 RepID=A0ABD7IT18_LACPE|nr:aldo/keto reductase [Lactiplantibacillus pentosus]MCJ8185985.1 aldo/keto reductase [Lactiplantibacillus pentosus]MCT3303982.1 aldo/keto reductase [Lactiplantibacillus pentosus]MCT3310243.1 aldo/keto reductase [Lactiplantibacillus pentosus]PRO77963.1 aldo/keto reductase [Lactiplantibacillus pentosus]PRO82097.1 aldo/keto reductase [Lactiplantibacillus pentosus]